MALETKSWDVQDHLKTPEDCLLFLQAAFDDAGDDPTFIAQAVGEVARSVGMASVARDTGISREGLYRALAASGNPSLDTIVKVLGVLGFKLGIQRLESNGAASEEEANAA